MYVSTEGTPDLRCFCSAIKMILLINQKKRVKAEVEAI